MLRRMDAQQALSDLTEISSQIQTAVIFDDKGKVAGSTLGDEARAGAFAQAADNLLSAADAVGSGESPLTQLEVATGDGSVFVVREEKTTIAATTAANPTVGLVFYDLKSALRSLKPKRAAPARKKTAAASKKKTAASKKKTTARKRKTDAS